MSSKICKTCNVNKSIFDFSFSNKSLGIRQNKCKECQKNYRKRYAEYFVSYRKKNKDKIKSWYENNKNELKNKQKIYQETNKDKIKAVKKKYYDSLFGTEKGISDRFSRAKAQAKKRNIEFSISLDDFRVKIQDPCYYCNFLLGNIIKTGSGLDRIDSDKGYTIDNVVSCCAFCNKIKSDLLTAEETKELIGLLLKIRTKKEHIK